MSMNASALQVAAQAVAADINKLSLHTADPGAAGTSNKTTAADQAVVCTATSGVVTAPSTAFTGGAASGACTYVGLWHDTTFRGAFALTGDQAFNAAGEYTVDSVTVTISAV